MSLASKLPWNHRFAGGFPGLSSQPLPTDADAIDYLTRMATADGAGVEVGVATAVDAFFRDAKELGVFSALKACCILAGARTLAGALVPVVGDAPTNVADGFVEGDYSRTAGLTGDGTSYIDSGRANDDDPQNDNHNAVFITAINSQTQILGSRNSTTGRNFMDLGGGGNKLRVSARSNTVLTAAAAPDSGTVIAHARSDSAEMSYRLNGVTYTDTLASESPDVDTLLVYARRNVSTGVAENFSTNTLAFYSIGTSLSLEDLDTAVTNLITAIGEAL